VASLIENLTDILQKEHTEYEKLLELSMKKTPIIVRGDVQELQKITDEEQDVVQEVSRLSKKREELMSDIASVMNKDVQTLTLKEIIGILESRKDERARLAALYDGLKATVENMNRSNNQNKELLENALEMVEFDMNLVKGMNSAPETAEYNKGAYAAGGAPGGSGAFDARQ